jgi:hypothetical protein
MVQLTQGLLPLAAGAVASCAAFLAVTGAGKVRRWLQVRRGARLVDDDDVAIRRALRLPRRAWQALGPAVGGLELVAGALVCSGAGRYAEAGGAAMAALGAVFAGLLGYVRLRRVSGGCGCNSWRRRPEPVTGRSVARAGLICCAGLAELTVLAGRAWPGGRGAAGPAGAILPWYAGGVAAGAVILLLASAEAPVRTVICGRPVLFPVRRTLRALARHGVFAAMAASAGPFEAAVRHRRARCADEFWFTSQAGPVAFEVEYARPGGVLAVRTSLAGPAAPGRLLRTSWPPRRAGSRPARTEVS